jgi:hypothetical protein
MTSGDRYIAFEDFEVRYKPERIEYVVKAVALDGSGGLDALVLGDIAKPGTLITQIGL